MVVSRDVDKLDPLPDAALQEADKVYLARHGLDRLLADMLTAMLEQRPLDPIQFMIDSIEFSPEHAAQDPATGLPQHRRNKLQDVFRIIDQEGHGKISFSSMQKYAGKYGGTPLGAAELQSMFNDFHPGQENLITLDEFLVYFGKVSRTIKNSAFEQMIQELIV